MKLNKYVIGLYCAFALSLVLHLGKINQGIQGLHSWRQSQTMWNIKNFVRHDANILNPRTCMFNGDNSNIYRYELPIMQWGIAMIEKITGENIAIVRLLVFLIGVFATLGFFLLLQLIIRDD